MDNMELQSKLRAKLVEIESAKNSTKLERSLASLLGDEIDNRMRMIPLVKSVLVFEPESV